MACCKCCCGGENCAEGQQGKCCCGGPSGTCCQSDEYCCSGSCQSDPCDEQVCCLWGWCYDIGGYFSAEDCTYYGGTVMEGTCAEDPCPPPDYGACCDGTYCYVTSVFDCWGTWQGVGTTCSPNPCVDCYEHSDCPEGKYCCKGECLDEPCPYCKSYSYPECNVINARCTSGEDVGYGDPCDPTLPDAPTAPPFDCVAGASATPTVTGSGYSYPDSSDAAFKTFIENSINTSYAASHPCVYGGYAIYPIAYDGSTLYVIVMIGRGEAYIGITATLDVSGGVGAPWIAILGGSNPSAAPPISSSCGTILWDCSGFTATTENGTLSVS